MDIPVVMAARPVARVEYPTLGLVILVYVAWAGLTIGTSAIGLWIAVPVLGLVITLHSSLQHEIIHGHPFRDQRLNVALVYPALGLFIPFGRFQSQHLAHHHDPSLTDPYDDPETNYLDPVVWSGLGRWMQRVLQANNTLLGRMVIGPVVGMAKVWGDDAAAIASGDRAVGRAYLHHALGIVPVVLWLGALGTMPVWAYLLAAWLALAILRIRTFLEHRADEDAAARTVIIEDRGPLALLFLNNNYHSVHHACPGIPWHRLPAEYRRRKPEFLARNGGYVYRSYAEVFARYLVTPKDPVPHPLRPGGTAPSSESVVVQPGGS